jgi:hypothetical protein
MLYSDIKKRLPELCKELVLMIPKDIEYSYHEDYEGNVSVKIVKDEDRINLEINDIKFSIGPSYFAERYYLNCEKYEDAFSRNPEPIILLSKLFTNLACESDKEFNKIIGEGDQESDKGMIRFQIMKIAKGFNDLHGWFSNPAYLKAEIEEAEERAYYAEQRKRDEDSFWEEMAAVGVTPEDVYD